MKKIKDYFPDIYKDLLPNFFNNEIGNEKLSDCNDCIKLENSNCKYASPDRENFFSPKTKCCTYHPKLSNYLVGGLLKAGGDGAKRIKNKIENRVKVSPKGIYPPKLREYIFNNMDKASTFGKIDELLCPYYDDGACTVWSHREATCSTFFCNPNYSIKGSIFWDSVKLYMQNIQRALEIHCLLELGYSIESSDKKLYNYDLDPNQLMPDQKYNEIWAHWSNREEDFYIQCNEIVTALSKEKFESLSGIDDIYLLTICSENYDYFQKIPERIMITKPEKIIENEHKKFTVKLNTEAQLPMNFNIIELIEKYKGNTSEIINTFSSSNSDFLNDFKTLLHHGIIKEHV